MDLESGRLVVSHTVRIEGDNKKKPQQKLWL